MSIFKLLSEYKELDIYPFHMPGHKRNTNFLLLGCEAALLDVTELPQTDNLHDPKGVIASRQKDCARLFGASHSFFLAGGSTSGVISAICACGRGGKVIMGRNSHKSAYSAIIYSGANPVYIYPQYDTNGIPAAISPGSLDALLKENPDAACVFITSPTYEGYVSDIKSLSETAHKYGIPLIVDEAHGAHFPFSPYFPKPALSLGADISIQSLHKTLPAFTQSAVLHVKSSLVDMRLLRLNLAMAQSTSPSYILLSGIDKCLGFLEKSESAFKNFTDTLASFRKAASFKNLPLLGEGNISPAFDYDSSKLVFINPSSINAENFLLENKIQIEMDAGSHFLLMSAVADTKEGFERALKALEMLNEKAGLSPRAKKITGPVPAAKIRMAMKDAMYSPSRPMKLKDAKGQTSAGFITPYPPGVPLIAPGEEITSEILGFLNEKYLFQEIHAVNRG